MTRISGITKTSHADQVGVSSWLSWRRNTRFHSNRAFLKFIRSARSNPVMFKYPIICATCVSVKQATTFGSTMITLSTIRSGTRLPINSPRYQTGNERCTETTCPLFLVLDSMRAHRVFHPNPVSRVKHFHRSSDYFATQVFLKHLLIRVIRVIRGKSSLRTRFYGIFTGLRRVSWSSNGNAHSVSFGTELDFMKRSGVFASTAKSGEFARLRR